MLESLVWNFEFSNWWNNVSSNLGALAFKALSCPLRHILPDGRPDDLGTQRLTRPLDARMAESMQDFENTFPESIRYVWPCRTITDVDDQLESPNVD